jgi:hypothetical protein
VANALYGFSGVFGETRHSPLWLVYLVYRLPKIMRASFLFVDLTAIEPCNLFCVFAAASRRAQIIFAYN